MTLCVAIGVADCWEMASGSGPWPCDFPAAATVTLAQPSSLPIPPPIPPGKPGTRIGQADLQPAQIQDLADVMGDLLKARAGLELTFHVRVEVSAKEAPSEDRGGDHRPEQRPSGSGPPAPGRGRDAHETLERPAEGFLGLVADFPGDRRHLGVAPG